MIRDWVLAGLSLATAMAVPLGSMAADAPLAVYRDKARVLLVVAPEGSDPRVGEQRKLFGAMRAGARERDLVLVEAIGDTPRARAVRDALGIDTAQFRVVLIGKDGGEKLTSSAPLGPHQLFPLVDSMPMRQDEMRRRTS